jgi:hypothetical protein
MNVQKKYETQYKSIINNCDVSLCVLFTFENKIIISMYTFQIKMPNAKLETADELHALFSDDDKLKGLSILILYFYQFT